jgi:hypothetical protein
MGRENAEVSEATTVNAVGITPKRRMPGKAGAQTGQGLPQALFTGNHAMRIVDNALPFRREPGELLAAFDRGNAEFGLEVADRGRECLG